MDISLTQIHDLAAPDVVARGREYFHQGRVTLETVSDGFVRARVDGSDSYAVELHEDASGFEATCTCPFQWEGKCKHIVAAMLATLYRNAKLEYTPDHMKRNGRDESMTGWAHDLKPLLSSPEGPEPETDGRAWRLAYSLKISGKKRFLYPLKMKSSIDGRGENARVLKRFDPFGDPHFDHIDRILLEKIGGGFSTIVPDGDNAGEEAGDEEWGVNDATMSDMLHLLVGKEVYACRNTNYVFRRLHAEEEPARVNIGITETAEGALTFEPEIEHAGERHTLAAVDAVVSIDTLWVLAGDKILRVAGMSAADFFVLAKLQKNVVIPAADRGEFLEEALPRLVKRFRVRSELPSLQSIELPPRPRVYLSEFHEKLHLELRFLYGILEVRETAADAAGILPELIANNGTTVVVHRRMDDEGRWSAMLSAHALQGSRGNDGTRTYIPSMNPYEWLMTKLPLLRDAGVEIYGQEALRSHRLRAGRPRIGLRVSSGIDWFDLSVAVKFDGGGVAFRDLADAVRANNRFVKLDDGTVGVLPDAWLRKFRRVFAMSSAAGESMKLSRAHVGLLSDLLGDADDVASDEEFEGMLQRLKSFSTIKHLPLPQGFRGELRPYQKAGYDWLHFLAEFGVGGILADDMGLGKTVQALALLNSVYEQGATLPSLIVVPTSPMFNWLKEVERFTPALRTLMYAGGDRAMHHRDFDSHQLIITSYGILRRDIEFLKERKFLYVVLDESQNIKNPISVNAQAVRALRARHRLSLSGTPVENNLHELWSQFAFLNPGMLGSERTFTEYFARPIEKLGDESASDALRKLLFPFILRRTKELVATELPPKVESTVFCEMDAEQQRVYDYWRDYFRQEILQSIDAVGFQRSKLKVLEGLMKLRQVCCHPLLVDDTYRGTAGKFEAFIEMLDDILAEGHKVLVFSQFVKMLTVLRRHCDEEGIIYEYLDGSTTNRRERVERFQEDEKVKLFLISLKAGGTGLNLTAADYVIHYDPWWNPAVEMQATDRTHRIGQTKQVFAYKLITRESVEEKILALQEKKKELVKSIITTDSGFMKALTREDVEALFT